MLGRIANLAKEKKQNETVKTMPKKVALKTTTTFNKNQNATDKKAKISDKSFACTHCDKKFNWLSDFIRHERIHTGEKPYACKHCDKKFTRSGELKVHERIHTGEKPFACKHCDKKLTESGQLKMHERIKAGEKPFSCIH